MNDFSVKGEESLKKRWNDKGIAEHYTENRFSQPVWEFMHKKEVGVVNELIKPGIKLLDLATGPARVAKDLKGDFTGVAVDYAEEMLAVARQHLDEKRWTIQKDDAFALNFSDKTFDMVTSFRFVRHFELKDRIRIYQEVKRVLKDGGVFIFEALNSNLDRYLFKEEYTGAANKSLYDELWTKDELNKELNDNGFGTVKLVSNINLGRLYFALAKILPRGILQAVIGILDNLDFGKCFQWEVVVRKNH